MPNSPPLELIPGAAPFYFPGNEIGCLLLHGYTASPQEMRGLGEHLASEGYTVYGPRLPFHGSIPDDMNRARWHDWYLATLDAWRLLCAQCERVAVIGLSMGSTTALLLAAQQPVDVVVSLSTLIHWQPDWRLRFAPYIWWLYPHQAKSGVEDVSLRWTGRYKVRPVRSIFEIGNYVRAVAPLLPRFTAPILFIHSEKDALVSVANMESAFEQVGSKIKERFLLSESDHVITEDIEKEIVFVHIADFIRRQVGIGKEEQKQDQRAA